MTFWQFSLCMVFSFFCGVGFEKLSRRLDSRPSWGKAKHRDNLDRINDAMEREGNRNKPEFSQYPAVLTASQQEIDDEAEKIYREHHPENDPGLK